MQFWGQYETRFDEEFLTSSYLYFNEEDEELSLKDFKQLIKTQKLRKKNIAGTIIMYNPFYFPEGYDEKKSLTSQGFDFDSDFQLLKIEKEISLLRATLKNEYKGQIVELKFLFNLNIKKIDHLEMLMKLNEDAELLNSHQLTHFDKSMNYIDIQNLVINGKFVFFAWGHKTNKNEFLYIHNYAQSIYDKCVQMQKSIAFIYKRSTQLEYAQDNLNFIHPVDTGKFKHRMPESLKKAFSTKPPQCAPFDDIK